jgi:hypothetical protein
MNPIFIKIFFGFVSLFILAGCGSSSSTSAINLTDEFWGVAVDDPNNSTQLYISNFTKGGLGSVPIASGATGGTVTSMTTSTSGFYGPEGMVVVGLLLHLTLHPFMSAQGFLATVMLVGLSIFRGMSWRM